MRKRIILTAIIIVLQSTLCSQQWIPINPQFNPSGNYNIRFGEFNTKDIGWCTDRGGRIWKTINGGLNWEAITDSSEYWILDFDVVDSVDIWTLIININDDTKYLKYSQNGGETWNQTPTNNWGGLYFIDSLTGFLGGKLDTIQKTINGGNSWVDTEYFGDIHMVARKFYFFDDQYGWAIGDRADATETGIILKTEDGGDSWSNVGTTSIYGTNLFFHDTLHGGIAGLNPFYGGELWTTNNGGDTWDIADISSAWLNDICYFDANNIWVVGEYGFVWHSIDAGINWELVDIGTTETLNRISFVQEDSTAYIFGASNTIYKFQNIFNDIDDSFSQINSYCLLENFPNPFNSTTTIKYNIPEKSKVTINIYNSHGQLVRVQTYGSMNAGFKTIQWNGSDNNDIPVASGVYLYNISAKSLESNKVFTDRKKMILMK